MASCYFIYLWAYNGLCYGVSINIGVAPNGWFIQTVPLKWMIGGSAMTKRKPSCTLLEDKHLWTATPSTSALQWPAWRAWHGLSRPSENEEKVKWDYHPRVGNDNINIRAQQQVLGRTIHFFNVIMTQSRIHFLLAPTTPPCLCVCLCQDLISHVLQSVCIHPGLPKFRNQTAASKTCLQLIVAIF